MADREKVIKGLEEAHDVIEKHVPVRYWGYSTFACTDAIALLKAQGQEIEFLKNMQRQMVDGFGMTELGEMVSRAVKWE